MATLFLFAGTIHLVDPTLFLPAMPPWVPAPLSCIVISGVAELAGGMGLLWPGKELRRAAGWGLLLLLTAVFPANLYMATNHVRIHGFPSHSWLAWARLPLQPVFMALVAWTAGVWPKSS